MYQKYNNRIRVWMLIDETGRIVGYSEDKFKNFDVVGDIEYREVKK